MEILPINRKTNTLAVCCRLSCEPSPRLKINRLIDIVDNESSNRLCFRHQDIQYRFGTLSQLDILRCNIENKCSQAIRSLDVVRPVQYVLFIAHTVIVSFTKFYEIDLLELAAPKNSSICHDQCNARPMEAFKTNRKEFSLI